MDGASRSLFLMYEVALNTVYDKSSLQEDGKTERNRRT
jgi:hypothetical protein